MKRLVFNQLTEWKNKAKRKPLVVTGARQCGKTYAIKEFGTQEFENLAYFNFEGNEALKSIFDYDLNVKRIIEELVIYSSQKIEAGKTHLFFNEIQVCPKFVDEDAFFDDEEYTSTKCYAINDVGQKIDKIIKQTDNGSAYYTMDWEVTISY